MKTLGDMKRALASAIEHGDAKTVGEICDRLRFRGWGPVAPFRYADLLAFAQDAVPGLTPAAWDALLAQADELDTKEG